MQKLTRKEIVKEKKDLEYAKTLDKSKLMLRRKQYFVDIPDDYESDIEEEEERRLQGGVDDDEAEGRDNL